MKTGVSSSHPGAPCPVRDQGWGTAAAPIRAVLVFNDPAGRFEGGPWGVLGMMQKQMQEWEREGLEE
jgi:hypothetical protein